MTRRRNWMLAGALTAPLVVGCGEEPTTQPTLQPVGDLHETMTWVLDPAADAIWNSAGFVITDAGEQSLAPTDDEGWASVKHGAAVLAESGNLLMMPHLLPDQGDGTPVAAWQEYARGMTRIAQLAMQAADDQDTEALFEIGGQLYNVCLACHQAYARDAEA